MCDAPPSLSPFDVARRIDRRLRPWWVVWFGRYTRHYWAMALWVPGPAVIEAPTSEILIQSIANFEMFHPHPRPHPHSFPRRS